MAKLKCSEYSLMSSCCPQQPLTSDISATPFKLSILAESLWSVGPFHIVFYPGSSDVAFLSSSLLSSIVTCDGATKSAGHPFLEHILFH